MDPFPMRAMAGKIRFAEKHNHFQSRGGKMRKASVFAALLMVSLLPLAAQTITLISPGGGENWTIGNTAMILWNSSGVASARLILYRFGTAAENRIGVIAEGLQAASGSHSWQVGTYEGGTVPAGSGYYTRVRSLSGDVSDVSDAPFTIAAAPQLQPSFTLFLPNGGESWEKGSDKFISWSASNMPANCRLVLLKDGQVLGVIRDSLPPGGPGGSAVPWKVGETLGGSAAAGSGYRIRIQSLDGQTSDTSDNPFAISQPLIFHPQGQILRPILLPDLVVCLAWAGTIPYIYQDRRVSVRVKNAGLGSAPASSFKIYVEGHGDQVVQVPALAPQAEFAWSKKYDWKSCGHKTVRVTADVNGQVAESHESNNMLQDSLKVSCGETGFLLEVNRCSNSN
jgi:hypothetical protein